jgi:hypothetical protein
MNSEFQSPQQFNSSTSHFAPVDIPIMFLSVNTLVYGACHIQLANGSQFVIEDLKHLTEVMEREHITDIKVRIEK